MTPSPAAKTRPPYDAAGQAVLGPSSSAVAAYLASPQAIADLSDINAAFIHNFVTNDVARHDALLHPAFVTIQGDGSVLDRATYLEHWATGYDPDLIPRWETRDERITIVGSTALVRSTNVFAVAVGPGETRTRAALYTDTYVYDGRDWLCIQAQITPVQPAHIAPPDTVVSIYVRGTKESS